MPGLDKTGPEGKGSKTGRGLGNCNNKLFNPENENEQNPQRLGRNFRRRLGKGKNSGGQGNRQRYRGGQEK
jgi:hypothetical protein